MDPSDGGLTQLQIVPASNPSFVALDPTQTHLYSVNENLAGNVSAYVINPNGTLSFLNTASANGAFTTHISVQPSGQYVFAANYGNLGFPGSFPVYRILANGAIGPMTDIFLGAGNGTGPNPERQEAPHAHQILTDLDQIFPRWYHRSWTEASELGPSMTPGGEGGSQKSLHDTVVDYLKSELANHDEDERNAILALVEQMLDEEKDQT